MERYGRSFRDECSGQGRSAFIGGGFSWSPRSYTCSFCKREFKSAQALGGHMNVHRRDRARLRQSPPWDPPLSSPYPNPNPNPNPNPVPNLNFSPPPCSSEAKPSPVTYTFPSLLSPRTCYTATATTTAMSTSPTLLPEPFLPRCDELMSARAVKALFGVRKMGSFMEEDDIVLTRSEREVVGIDLEMEVAEDLDLELRLGYT